jgi:hypothetical protein
VVPIALALGLLWANRPKTPAMVLA